MSCPAVHSRRHRFHEVCGTAAERMRLRLCSTSIADSEKGGLDGAVAGVTTKLGFVVGLPSRRDWLLATKTSLH